PKRQTQERLTAISTDIEKLPTLGVDRDAVKQCLAAAKAHRALAQWIGDYDLKSGKFLEAAVRGLFGDPLGVAIEAEKEFSTVRGRFKTMEDGFIDTRAALTDRYGIEFPPVYLRE